MTARTAAHPNPRRADHKTSAERKAERRRAAQRRAAQRKGFLIGGLALLFLLIALAVRSPSVGAPAEPAEAGAVTAVADATFPASTGGDVTLAQYRGAPLVLYFYEGQSCGACQTQLLDIQAALPALEPYDANVLAVTTDPIDVSTSVASQLALSYPIVEDVDHALGSAMGTFVSSGHMGAVDQHSVVVLAPDGSYSWRSQNGNSMYVSPGDIVAAVEAAAA
jgi:peroxiredoxin